MTAADIGRRRIPRLGFLGVVGGLVLACASDPAPPDDGPDLDPPAPGDPGPALPSPPEPGLPVPVSETVIATGLAVPWDVAFAPDGRTFVTERDSGRLLERRADGELDEVHVFDDVDPAGEGGLLGVAVSPDWEADGRLYVYYTGQADNRIVRLIPGGAPEVVLDGIPKSNIHNGGRIAFGPDGMLYAGTGDAASSNLSARLDSLAGKILRMTPDGDIPDDNPLEDSYVYAWGLRNVQGIGWDWAGRLWASDFGPDVDDEVNRIVPGGDYGWPAVTGFAGDADFRDPAIVRQPPEASWSGLAIQIDGAIPQWEGSLFAAALRGQRLWRFTPGPDGDYVDDQAFAETLYEETYGRLRHVAQAPDGSLWLLTSNRDGRLPRSPDEDDDRIIRIAPE